MNLSQIFDTNLTEKWAVDKVNENYKGDPSHCPLSESGRGYDILRISNDQSFIATQASQEIIS